MTDTQKIIPCPICAEKPFQAITYRFDKGRIVRCLNCGHLYLNPPLRVEILNSIYENYYDGSEDAFRRAINSWVENPCGPYQYALASIEKASGFWGKRVLDIGCGPGRFLYECHQRGAKVTGIDSDPRAILLAKKYFGLNLSCGKIEEALKQPEFTNAEFDFIFAFEIIEHVQNPLELLGISYKLLTPGGLFFVSTPNFHLFYLMGNCVFTREARREHIHFFEPSSLAKYLRQRGFQILNITSLNPIKYGQRQKYRLLGNFLVKKIWEMGCRCNFVRSVKNTIIDQLDKHMDSGDEKFWNGQTLLCIARKPQREPETNINRLMQ